MKTLQIGQYSFNKFKSILNFILKSFKEYKNNTQRPPKDERNS